MQYLATQILSTIKFRDLGTSLRQARTLRQCSSYLRKAPGSTCDGRLTVDQTQPSAATAAATAAAVSKAHRAYCSSLQK